MSMQLTFTGETFKDLLAQMTAVAIAMGSPAAVAAMPAEPLPITREAERTDTDLPPFKTPVGRLSEATKELATADKVLAELPQTAVDAPAPADIAKLKEKALERVRDVYASGQEGQAKVKVLTAKYGVKKFAAIPDERVSEFYDDAMGL